MCEKEQRKQLRILYKDYRDDVERSLQNFRKKERIFRKECNRKTRTAFNSHKKDIQKAWVKYDKKLKALKAISEEKPNAKT